MTDVASMAGSAIIERYAAGETAGRPVVLEGMVNESCGPGRGMCVIARADASGLASMSVDFCREMVPDVALVVDSHGRGATVPSRIKAKRVIPVDRADLQDYRAMERHWEGCQTLVSFETWYHWPMAAHARRCGLRTVLFPMWECSSDLDVQQADTIVCVSDQDLKHYPLNGLQFSGKSVRHDWPINPAIFNRGEKNQKLRFVHNCGTFGLNNRNNSDAAIAACASVTKHGAEFLCRAVEQPEFKPAAQIEVVDLPREHLFSGVDVFVFPVGMPGLCLPTSETSALQIPTVVMDLPQWAAWPDHMRVPVKRVDYADIGSRRVEYARPDLDAFISILSDLASGRAPLTPPPPGPSWSDFKAFWNTSIAGA